MDRFTHPRLTRRWLARLVVVALVVSLLVPPAHSYATHTPVELQPGHVAEPANGTTVIAVQGFKLAGQNNSKKPARLVAVGPDGTVEWEHTGGSDIFWFYDVDPLPDGTLLVTGTNPSGATVFKYDPSSNSRVWTEHLDTKDTHDVDLINGDELLVADMRAYNETTGQNDAGLFIYNRTTGERTWEWHLRSHYSREDGASGKWQSDWSHINDVDEIGEGRYLASPRNMDEVILVNRSSGGVDWTLGTDGNHSVLFEQHNPNYLTGENGTPTVLVADSENDRVVEYAMNGRDDGNADGDGSVVGDADGNSKANGNATWTKTWELGVNGSLKWPRDADRLPNGNTLVTDSLNHRVMEVTPEGEVVWEFYAPWGTYEAERVHLGDEPGGPTIRQQGATGSHALNGSAQLTPGAAERPTFAEWLANAFAGTPISGQVHWFADRWSHAVPWIRPVWMDPWAFVSTLGAGLLVLGWATAEAVVHRRGIRARTGAAVRRASGVVRSGDGAETAGDGAETADGGAETVDDAGDD